MYVQYLLCTALLRQVTIDTNFCTDALFVLSRTQIISSRYDARNSSGHLQIAASAEATFVSTEDVPADFVAKETAIEMEKEDILSKPEAIRYLPPPHVFIQTSEARTCATGAYLLCYSQASQNEIPKRNSASYFTKSRGRSCHPLYGVRIYAVMGTAPRSLSESGASALLQVQDCGGSRGEDSQHARTSGAAIHQGHWEDSG